MGQGTRLRLKISGRVESLPPARSVYTAEYIYRARVAIHGNPIYVHGALGFIYIYICNIASRILAAKSPWGILIQQGGREGDYRLHRHRGQVYGNRRDIGRVRNLHCTTLVLGNRRCELRCRTCTKGRNSTHMKSKLSC